MIEIELKEAEIEALLSQLLSALSDMTPVMQDLGEVFVANAEARYDRGVDPDGTPWLAKTFATHAAYERGEDRVDYRPLFKTGKMRRTLFYKADAESVAYGSNAIQAAVMQWGAAKGASGTASNGSPIPWGDIPARPFIGLSEKDRIDANAIISKWLARAAGE